MPPLIVFCAPPFAGHLNPIVTLAQFALRAGYRVELLTSEEKVATVNAAGVPAFALASLPASTLTAISDTAARVGSDPLRLAAQMRQALALIGPVRDELIARWRADRPALVIADFTAVPAGLAADALGIVWATTLRPPFVLETMRGPPSYLGGLGPWPGPIGALRDRLGWALVKTAKDGLALAFRKELAAVGVKRLRADGSESIYSPYALLSTTMRELEFHQSWPAHLTFLGPDAANPEQSAAPELPRDRPLVLASFGTHLLWAKSGLVRDVLALSEAAPEANFIISRGDASAAGTPPQRLAARVWLYGFVPYVETLPHCAAVIHHGGAGIVYAALAAGTPALVCPQDYDQFDFAARLTHFNLGVRVASLASASAQRALQHLLMNPPRDALNRFAAAGRAYQPAETFIAVVARLLETKPLPR
jgi:UDP:flavonoid glycosyltransferase YjiC (YdhE family)